MKDIIVFRTYEKERAGVINEAQKAELKLISEGLEKFPYKHLIRHVRVSDKYILFALNSSFTPLSAIHGFRVFCWTVLRKHCISVLAIPYIYNDKSTNDVMCIFKKEVKNGA